MGPCVLAPATAAANNERRHRLPSDRHRRQGGHTGEPFPAHYALPYNDLPALVHADEMKNTFCEINTNDAKLLGYGTRSSGAMVGMTSSPLWLLKAEPSRGGSIS